MISIFFVDTICFDQYRDDDDGGDDDSDECLELFVYIIK